MPAVVHMAETMANHVIELVVPFMIFLPRPFRLTCGLLQVLFQVTDKLAWCLFLFDGLLRVRHNIERLRR